jgi:hypothetical protein
LRRVHVLFDFYDVPCIGDLLHRVQRGDREVLRADRLVVAEAAGTEGARLAQLDDGSNIGLQARQLLTRNQSALDQHGEKANYDCQQHHDDRRPDAIAERVAKSS